MMADQRGRSYNQTHVNHISAEKLLAKLIGSCVMLLNP